MNAPDTPTILWSRHESENPTSSSRDSHITRAGRDSSNFQDHTSITVEPDISVFPTTDEETEEPDPDPDEDTVEALKTNPFFQDLNISGSLYAVDCSQIISSRREDKDSLYSLLSRHCETCSGKRQMKFLLLHPHNEKSSLERQLDYVEAFVNNTDILQALRPLMRRVVPITRAYNRFSKPGHPVMTDWRSVLQTLEAIDDLRQALRMDTSLHIYRQQLDSQFNENIDVFRESLQRAMDVEDSVSSDKFIIKPGYSLEIDTLRANMQEIDVYLKTAAVNIKKLWQEKRFDSSINYSIGYLEDVGFIIMLPTNTPSAANIAFNLDKIMTRAFGNEHFVCYRHEYLDALDDHYHKPRAQIDAISWDVHERFRLEFLEISESINELIDCIGTLDVYTALASAAVEYKWNRPIITDYRFSIKRGYHPMLKLQLEAEKKEYVSNNFDGESRVKIITGANNSGKSVYIAQVALITHLAMCASFVPAESAEIPMVDKILAVCKSIHTTTNDVSLFASDISKMQYALDNVTSRSLVLIDEFGKSTRPEDGTALLLAVIQKLLFMRPLPPHTLVVTHFHSVAQLLPPEQPHVHYLESDILNGTDYQYSFKQGKAKDSLASLVYKEAKLDPTIAERAREIEEILRTRGTLMPSYDDRQSDQMRNARKTIEKFLKVNSSSYHAIEKFFNEVTNPSNK